MVPGWMVDLWAGDGRFLVVGVAVMVVGALLVGAYERRH